MRGVMRAPLRWVLWDVKDTLLKVRSSVGEQYCKEAERMGLSLSPAEVDAAFLEAYQRYSSRYPNYGITQGLGGQSWWMGVVRDTFSQCRVRDPALLNTMAHNLYHNFSNAENWEVFPDSKKALESCCSLGLKLGVVSNFDSRLEAILHVCGLLSHFTFLITSEEAGVAKPSPVIFDQALQKCGVPAASVAHIGDHYVNDYLASRSVGIHGFLLDRHKKHNHPDVPREHQLTSLQEVPSWLQQHMD
ncbi:haloacid dehalogenase-like hydrolase domain-containing protein 3 isoform X2 [Xiphias gladius]|uniref:haloacid dehalogenase-like hydrolase domain-containing protein 3 isoform X2 n=1 Tax=Xiphias gladius TaxID=8245 RepID=UPI001A98CF00|nr:haloacid dehalogenase-like hydrolase domain-containing protein 3 isoform X2 [Xiphias gladius]XP_040014437.1 haloacid dehalogenase-like hydrolase domain-containing protein 3 isoform X2 [Xiphias gladius]XP_040014438.1 haloacid dehalogenase-like hydrolase domain-containing protein 3 isoform X2 [Xiphias gladius]